MSQVRIRTLATLAVAGLALAACGSSSKTSTTPPTTTPAAATTTAPPTSAAAGETTTSAAPSSATATVQLAGVNTAKAGGKKVLVDSKGMTLYIWDNDTTPGQAQCKGGCATAWPPLVVSGTPTYGAGLTAAMFSVAKGPNGEQQLAVNGKPLYYWASDKKAGDATGDGINGFYVVGADGKKIDAG